MSLEKIKKILDEAFDYYLEIVEQEALKIFEEKVKPYCLQHSFDLLTGNGEWYIVDPKIENFTASIISLKERGDDDLLAILSATIPGCPQNDLGSLMPRFIGGEIRV